MKIKNLNYIGDLSNTEIESLELGQLSGGHGSYGHYNYYSYPNKYHFVKGKAFRFERFKKPSELGLGTPQAVATGAPGSGGIFFP